MDISLRGYPEAQGDLCENPEATLRWLTHHWVYDVIINVGENCRYGFSVKAEEYPWVDPVIVVMSPANA